MSALILNLQTELLDLTHTILPAIQTGFIKKINFLSLAYYALDGIKLGDDIINEIGNFNINVAWKIYYILISFLENRDYFDKIYLEYSCATNFKPKFDNALDDISTEKISPN